MRRLPLLRLPLPFLDLVVSFDKTFVCLVCSFLVSFLKGGNINRLEMYSKPLGKRALTVFLLFGECLGRTYLFPVLVAT